MEPGAYEPEAGDIVAHCHDGRLGVGPNRDTYFSLGTPYGVGRPHYYVTMDENGGERSWWLGPDQADALGRKLVAYAEDGRRQNEAADQRRPTTG